MASYKEFLAERRKLIAKRLNEFLWRQAHTKLAASMSNRQVEVLIVEGESGNIEFKSSAAMGLWRRMK